MTTDTPVPVDLVNVNGTELLPGDTREQYRQKIARITLDAMVQFVGLLDAKGTVLEINQVALEGGGLKLSEVEGKPFWTTFWWQVCEGNKYRAYRNLSRAPPKANSFAGTLEIYGRANGKETIVIDASLCPVKDDQGNVVFIAAEGRDITEKKAQERVIAQKNEELQALLLRIKELDEIEPAPPQCQSRVADAASSHSRAGRMLLDKKPMSGARRTLGNRRKSSLEMRVYCSSMSTICSISRSLKPQTAHRAARSRRRCACALHGFPLRCARP